MNFCVQYFTNKSGIIDRTRRGICCVVAFFRFQMSCLESYYLSAFSDNQIRQQALRTKCRNDQNRIHTLLNLWTSTANWPIPTHALFSNREFFFFPLTEHIYRGKNDRFTATIHFDEYSHFLNCGAKGRKKNKGKKSRKSKDAVAK